MMGQADWSMVINGPQSFSSSFYSSESDWYQLLHQSARTELQAGPPLSQCALLRTLFSLKTAACRSSSDLNTKG